MLAHSRHQYRARSSPAPNTSGGGHIVPLDAINRARLAAGYQRDGRCPGALIKPQLAAAIAAADDWIDTNSAAFAAALPAAFRTATTPAQKGELLAYVLMRRIGKLTVQEDG